LSLEAYLEWEAQSPERHELVEGHGIHTEGQALLLCVDAPLDLHALYEDVELERA
jgi:hypothetical protein